MSERPADLIDQAEEVTVRLRDAGLANVRNEVRPQQARDENGEWPIKECVDCDVEIPEERLELARIRCVSCQEYHERQASLFYRR